MWDCKTSKMSQSPRAALNAFGLFAAEAPGRARAHVSAGWRPPLFRRRSPLHFSATYLNRFEDGGGADCGTSLDGVLRPWSLLPRPRTRRFLDRPCVAREHGALHRVVRDHLQTFLSELDRSEDEPGAPLFVKPEFQRFACCGVLAHGFALFRCTGCGTDRLVAFSCERRGFCPSCGGRRMTERAAHLVDEARPESPPASARRLPKRIG
jgi:hypothetical protein